MTDKCKECRPSRSWGWTPPVRRYEISLLFSSFLLILSLPICPLPLLSVFLSLHFSLDLIDHHRHQSDASLHLQPGPRAHRPGCEAGRLLPGEGGVWGGKAWWGAQAPGQESPHLPAFPDQIHRRWHGWVTHRRLVAVICIIQRKYFVIPTTRFNISLTFSLCEWLSY